MIERLFALVQAWEASGFAGLCVLALLFVVGTLSYMPRFSLYLIGGVVFGLAAIPAAIIGSTIGATRRFPARAHDPARARSSGRIDRRAQAGARRSPRSMPKAGGSSR